MRNMCIIEMVVMVSQVYTYVTTYHILELSMRIILQN